MTPARGFGVFLQNQSKNEKQPAIAFILLSLQRDASELCFIINIDLLEMKKEKTTIKESTAKSNVLPEFIAGIPTAKHRSKERMDLIRSYYQRLWKRLQREKGVYTVYNDYLGVDVYIIEKESDKKTVNAASKNWQSTYAVKNLYKVVRITNIFNTALIR